MMKTKKRNEDAVSPVIGVIMMVAVTVILAAIIASYVFGMAGSMQSSKTVGTTLTTNKSGYATATVTGGPDVSALNAINCTIGGGAEVELFPAGTATVGRSYTTASSVTGKRIVLIGYFNDGTSQILLDKQY
jgi:flagellin-like protein